MARFNVRLFDPDREFEYSRVASQELNLDRWHKSRAAHRTGERILVLEIGAGTQVPTVRKKVFGRGPGQRGFLCGLDGTLNQRASLVRINVEDASLDEVDEQELVRENRAVSFSMGALECLQKIDQAYRNLV